MGFLKEIAKTLARYLFVFGTVILPGSILYALIAAKNAESQSARGLVVVVIAAVAVAVFARLERTYRVSAKSRNSAVPLDAMANRRSSGSTVNVAITLPLESNGELVVAQRFSSGMTSGQRPLRVSA